MAWGDKAEVCAPQNCQHEPSGGCMWCCQQCNYDTHRCPGCGTGADHKNTPCPECVATYELVPRDQH